MKINKTAIYLLSVICCALVSDAFSAQPSNPRGARASSSPSQSSTQAPAVTSARAAARTGVVNSAPSQSPGLAVRGRTVGSAASTSSAAVAAAAPAVKTVAARAASTQKVINTGVANIKAATSTEGLVNETCKQKFFGCMDSFCMQDNANGARCICSDQVKTYDTVLKQIEQLDAQSLKLATEGVNRIDLGENASEIDKIVQNASNSVNPQMTNSTPVERTKRRTLDLNSFNMIGMETEQEEELEKDPLEGLTGTALQDGVRRVCIEQVREGCERDMNLLQTMYSAQVKNDCAGYEQELKKRLNASAQKLSTAQQAMRDAAQEAFLAQNKWNLGQCINEMQKCVINDGGCGTDFAKCTFYNTGEGLSSAEQTRVQVPGTKVSVAQGTLDSVQAKRTICEATVTKNCVAVKSQVWDAFLINIAPTMRSAELVAEDNQRQNRLTNISDCFIKACKDNMDPNNPDGSYDACLGNPAIMASSCQVVLNAAGVKADDTDATWGFVKQKLGAMRIDACTNEMKQCLQRDVACGADYGACLSLGLDDVRKMCPVDKLTGCVQNGQAIKSIDEIDDMIRGIYLNIDNAALTACQKAADDVMMKFCGDTASCDAFDSDKLFGVASLHASPKDPTTGDYTITGLVDFGAINPKPQTVGRETPVYGFDIDEYISKIPETANAQARSDVIDGLTAFNNKVNSVIQSITSDVGLRGCTTDRDMSQITGRSEAADSEENTETRTALQTARTPHILDQYMNVIYSAAIAAASKNYEKKFNELVASATDGQTDEINQVMCSAMGAGSSSTGLFGGSSGRDEYDVMFTVQGASINALQSSIANNEKNRIVTDSNGVMVARINRDALYDKASKVCKITTTTTNCKTVAAAVKTVTLKVKSSWFGLVKKSVPSTSYTGSTCTAFNSPVIEVETVDFSSKK